MSDPYHDPLRDPMSDPYVRKRSPRALRRSAPDTMCGRWSAATATRFSRSYVISKQ